MSDKENINALKEMASRIKESNINEVRNTLNLIESELNTNIENGIKKVGRLPEYVFVENFLDFFRSGLTETKGKPLLLKWLELAGGPYNEVDIIDENGNVIFTTPGIYVRPNIDLTNKFSFNNMNKTYELQANRMKALGENYLAKQFGVIESQIRLPDATKNKLRWEKIFKYYDGDRNIFKEDDTPQKDTTETSEVDFLDYD